MTRAAPRFTDEPPLGLSDVEHVVRDECFPDRPDGRSPGRVGLEIERFPIHPALGRMSIDTTTSILGSRFGEQEEIRDLPAFRIEGAGHLTFEPGGQVEHVTLPHDTAAAAVAECEAVSAALAAGFDASLSLLASAGIDVWHDLETVEQQLPSYRYPAMHEYFRARGHAGPLMMRHSCSLQINLDLGPPGDRAQRWLVGHLIAPLLTATFANSPGPRHVSMRAAAWQALDPTRTGFPASLVAATTNDPVEQITRAALEADVLLIRTAEGRAEPGRPGWTFGDWVRDGHPTFGPPTAADFGYHLSTLFLELRPRGKVEFRSIDAVPHPWRAVPVVVLVGAIEDARTRDKLIELLEGERARLPELWEQAASEGVAAPSFCAMAVEAWSYALEGASRLPSGYVTPTMLATTEDFLERFTLRGRCPSDELRERLAEGPAESLAWAAEPVPQTSGRTP